MNARPTFARPSSLSAIVAAALATFITIGLLTAVAFLFQRDGAPMAVPGDLHDPGTFNYICALHDEVGMTGRVIVHQAGR